MNRSLLSRIMPYLLAFYALSLAAFIVYALVTFSVGSYLPSMRWHYALTRAFLLFMDYLIPVHAAAVAVAASLSPEPVARGPARPFSRVVSSAIVAFLVLTAVYAALAEGVVPRARIRLADMQYRSRVAREYRRQANAAMQRADYRAALDALDRALVVEPDNQQLVQQRLTASSRAARQEAPGAPAAPAGMAAAAGAVDAEGAQAYVEKARSYAAQQDWFSAHYYAQQAVALDPRRVDALALASQASNMLAGLTQAQKDQAAATLFARKKDALERLETGDALGSYYAFLALQKDNPRDPDIARYLPEAAARLQTTSFFLDEARKVELLPGTQGILFFNVNDAEFTEAVSIAKMVEIPGGEAYFFGIEAVRYNSAGNVAWHFMAPYGRREGDAILMDAVDRADPGARQLPLYLQGGRPGAERAILRLRPGVEELRALSSGRAALAGMTIGEMWLLRSHLGAYGLARQSLGVEMTMRLVMPFSFLILSIFCTALGWALRLRTGGRVPGTGIVLMPLLPATLALMSLLYLHAHRVIIGFTVIGFGLTVSFIALAALQVVLLAVSLVLLAGQSSR